TQSGQLANPATSRNRLDVSYLADKLKIHRNRLVEGRFAKEATLWSFPFIRRNYELIFGTAESANPPRPPNPPLRPCHCSKSLRAPATARWWPSLPSRSAFRAALS